MRDETQTVYTFWTMLVLTVMLVGSPLAGFGCQTIVPEQFQLPCETHFGNTAVQNNAIQSFITAILVLVTLTFLCWFRPQYQIPQEQYLLPHIPPPRSFV